MCGPTWRCSGALNSGALRAAVVRPLSAGVGRRIEQHMGRYLQLILLILMAMVAGEAASADPVQAPLRVGHLYPRMEPWSAAFYEGLEEQGFVDGRNVVVITREAHADFSRAPLLADQLIAVSPTVLVAQTGTLAREAQRAVRLRAFWQIIAFPLVLAISIVYKSVRCSSMRRVPREALVLFVFIITVMVLAAGALAAVVTLAK